MLTDHIRNLIIALLHMPTPRVIDQVRSVIASEMSDTDTAGKIWLKIRQALDRIVGKGNWDTAPLIACELDSRIYGEVKTALSALKIPILTNPDERNLAAQLFAKSRLKVLILSGGPQAEIVEARQEFLVTLIDKLTEILFFPRRTDLYHIARTKAGIQRIGWLPHRGEDDYFNESYVKIRTQVGYVRPTNYSALMVNIMSKEMLSSFDVYNRIELLGGDTTHYLKVGETSVS